MDDDLTAHDEKRLDPTLEFLKLVGFFHKELDQQLRLTIARVLEEVLGSGQAIYSVDDIKIIFQAIEKTIKHINSQQIKRFPEFLHQNVVLQEILTSGSKEDIAAIQEAFLENQQLLQQREEEISHQSSDIETLNKRLYDALNTINEEQQQNHALVQEISRLKTHLSQIINESSEQIHESTLQSLMTLLDSTNSQELQLQKTKLEDAIREKDQLASDIKSLDKALHDLKIQYYQVLEKIDSQAQEIEEVLQENSRLRDLVEEQERVEIQVPITRSMDLSPTPRSDFPISTTKIEETESEIVKTGSLPEENLLNLADQLEARLEVALSSFKDLDQKEPVTAEGPPDLPVAAAEGSPSKPIESLESIEEDSAEFFDSISLPEQSIEINHSQKPLSTSVISKTGISEEIELPTTEVSEESEPSDEETIFPSPSAQTEEDIQAPISKQDSEMISQALPVARIKKKIVGSLNELFEKAPVVPEDNTITKTAGIIEQRFEELISTKSPINGLESRDVEQEDRSGPIVQEFDSLAESREHFSSDTDVSSIPEKFSQVYDETEKQDIFSLPKEFSIGEAPSRREPDAFFDWDPMDVFSKDEVQTPTDPQRSTPQRRYPTLIPIIIEKDKTQIEGLNKKHAKALKKHFKVKNINDILQLDPKAAAKKLGRKIKPEMVVSWKRQAKILLEQL